MRKRKINEFGLAGIVLLLATAGVRAQTPDPDATPATKIVPGCVLQVTVFDEPGLSGAFPVDADGNVLFGLVDQSGGNLTDWKVSVRAKTAAEAQEAITSSLKTYLRYPQVGVFISKLPRLQLEVNGAVKKTGRYEIRYKARLSDLFNANPPLSEADLANVRILRSRPGTGNREQGTEKSLPAQKGTETKAASLAEAKPKTAEKDTGIRTLAVDFNAYLRGESEDDPLLQMGDKIFVPSRPETKTPEPLKLVRVRGEVEREASIPLSPAMTVKVALERAGGLKPTADRSKIMLVSGATGNYYELEAAKIEADDPLHNRLIGANDLIIVGLRDQSLIFAVSGEVATPQSFPIDPKQPLTLLRAIEMVGGPTKNADLAKGIIRKNYLRRPDQTRLISFNLNEVRKGKQPDWPIEAGDEIILIPKVKRPSLFQQLLPFALRFFPFPFL